MNWVLLNTLPCSIAPEQPLAPGIATALLGHFPRPPAHTADRLAPPARERLQNASRVQLRRILAGVYVGVLDVAVELGYGGVATPAEVFVVASTIVAALALVSLTATMRIGIACAPTPASLLIVASTIVAATALVSLPIAMGIGTASVEGRFRFKGAILLLA